jgi:hypothetical protein
MIEKSLAGRRQLDALGAAAHQLDADFLFEIADLPLSDGCEVWSVCSAATVRLPASATAMK